MEKTIRLTRFGIVTAENYCGSALNINETFHGNGKARSPLHRLITSERLRIMTTWVPPHQLVQIVRVTITEDASGLLIAESADLPGRTAFASDMASLDADARDVIKGYFAKRGERVRIGRWKVETIEGNAQQLLAGKVRRP